MDWCVVVFLSAVGFFLTSLHLFFLYCTVLVTLWVVFGFSFFLVSVLFYVVFSISMVVASVLELSSTCCSGGWFLRDEVSDWFSKHTGYQLAVSCKTKLNHLWSKLKTVCKTNVELSLFTLWGHILRVEVERNSYFTSELHESDWSGPLCFWERTSILTFFFVRSILTLFHFWHLFYFL
jgi:hypothetical protein